MIANHRARRAERSLPRLPAIAAFATFVALAAFVLSSSPQPACAQSVSTQEQTAAGREAAAAFQARCSFCHGDHGEGSDVGASLGVPDLRSPAIRKQTDAALKTILREGKDNMPAFGKSYSDATLDALIRTIRKLSDAATLTH